MATDDSASFLSEIAIAEETTKGTAETSPDKYDYFIDDPTINPNQSSLKLRPNQTRSVRKNAPGMYYVEGSGMQQYVEPEGMLSNWLKWVLGGVVSAQQGGTAAYKHTFKTADTVKAFTMWLKRGDVQQVKHPYCSVRSLELNQSVDGALRSTVNFIGQKDVIATDFGSASYGTLEVFTNQMLEVSIAGAATGQAVQVHNPTIKFAQAINPEDGMSHGSRFYKALIAGAVDVTGSFDMWFDDDSEYQRFWGNAAASEPADLATPVPLIFTWDSGVEADTGYNYILEISVPDAIYESTVVNLGGTRIKQTINWWAQYDSGIASEVQVDLTNTETSI